MISTAYSLPLRIAERRAIEFLTRYHRGATPDGRDYAAFGEDASAMRVLLGLLRAADALDGRRLAPPALALKLREDRLEIRCGVHQQWRRARRTFRRRRKYHLLAESLGIKVRVRLRRADPALSLA